MPESVESVERYLHTHIPITRAMRVSVVSTDGAGVRLSAPLDVNINHRSTVFGGSASTLATLAAWTLLHLRLRGAGMAGQIVIQRSSVEYLRPMSSDFEAFCRAPAEHDWERFLATLTRRGRGRITLRAEIRARGDLAGTFSGVYVASRTVGSAA